MFWKEGAERVVHSVFCLDSESKGLLRGMEEYSCNLLMNVYVRDVWAFECARIWKEGLNEFEVN
jgi:hypothetical protein